MFSKIMKFLPNGLKSMSFFETFCVVGGVCSAGSAVGGVILSTETVQKAYIKHCLRNLDFPEPDHLKDKVGLTVSCD